MYSSLPAIYSLVPSIGSISQNVFRVFFFLKSTVSSEIIGIFGVKLLIFSVSILLTSRSPLVTGELSGLIIVLRPCFLSSMDFLPANSVVSIKFFYEYLKL